MFTKEGEALIQKANIDRAIEELSDQQRLGPDHAGTPFHTALGLGAEALKLIKAADFSGGPHTFKGKSVEACVLIRKDDVAAGPFADLLKE